LQDIFKNKDDNEDLEMHNHAGHLQDIMHKIRWGCFPSTNPKISGWLSIYLPTPFFTNRHGSDRVGLQG
jgi:hypothetical protein